MTAQPVPEEPRFFGARVKRVEDPRLLTGRGRFVDDIDRAGMLHGYFVRSVEPRARIMPIIDMTGSFGIILGMKNTTVMPSQITKTYCTRRGIRYRFTNAMAITLLT